MTQIVTPQRPPQLVRQDSVAGRLPNFLYIGTSKAGSTWIYQALADHPQVFMAPAKGTYFFDGHYDCGMPWYREHFSRAQDEAIVGEISHSYLFSRAAADRIRQHLPSATLMACLRHPVERAFSAYLDSVKNGQFSGTFEEAWEANPAIRQRSEYASYLEMYLERFSREQIHIALFDDLKETPQDFADALFEFLALPTYELPANARQKMMPAALPRARWLANTAKFLARRCERLGWREIRGKAKRSRLVRNLLYRPYRESERPTMAEPTRERLMEHFRPQVEKLDDMLGTTLLDRWRFK